ncbi:YfhO family protein [candidate division KSB1 bacterium]|nr:YfhO family protein [candidate division KSB1 bacterium]
MTKSKKSKKSSKPAPKASLQSQWQMDLKPWQQIGIAIVVIIIATVLLYSNLAFKGLTPAGSDVIGSMGKSHLLKQYEQETGEISLWNPAIFGGMPQYHRYGPQSFSLDKIVGLFYSGNSGQVVVHYIVGAVGMFLLLYSLQFGVLVSLFGAFAFLLMPHYNSLWLAGHFSKFRAIMYMPWVVMAFYHFITTRRLLYALLLALAFSLQIRTQHYQIIFYTALVLLAIGVWPIIKLIKEKNFKALGQALGLLALAGVFTILSVYQPLFVMKEYTPYSTRGGNPVHIEQVDQSAVTAKGVSFEYATKWSLSPRELLTLVIPNYFGGQSQIKYTGDAVPQLKGQRIPGYWGDMPFTSSTDYIGVALFVFMLLGIYGYRDDWRVRSLAIFSSLGILLGFGRHFPPFYKLFFYTIPYFSKFRIPTMILMAIFFVFVLLAAFGIRYLIERAKDDPRAVRVVAIIAGIMLILIVSPMVLKALGVLSFSQPQDAQMFNPKVLPLLQTARFDLAKMDAIRTFGFTLLVFGIIFSLIRGWLPKSLSLLLLIGVMILDNALVNTRFFDQLVPTETLEARLFQNSQVDNYLLNAQKKSPEPFRVMGVGQLFNNNDLAYYNQCIGGYDAAKMQTIQDLIDNNLYHGPNPQFPINWSMVNFMNGQFVVSEMALPGDNLKLVYRDERQKQFLYENPDACTRAFLVGQAETISDPAELLRRINDPTFNPKQTALLNTELPVAIAPPDSMSFARETKYTPNKIEVEAKTNTQCLMVMSEVYYPKGWKALVDGKETPIYKTNHILRSIVLPAGEHKIEFIFHPQTYFTGKWIASLSNIILLLSIVGIGYVSMRTTKNEE